MRIKSFRKEKSKQYYFRVFDNNEKQILRSEAYTSKAARDNGVASFKKNSAIPEMYERKSAADGSFFFNVKSPNGQVVATSLMFKSEEEREAVIASILNYSSGASKTNVKASSSPSGGDASKAQDDYMAAAFYQDSGSDTASGFDRFQKGASDLYYFSFKSDDGKVLLMSQGYTAEAGRDNGIASVEKNSKEETRFHTNTEDGKYYFILKAGNHQEIARSVNFDSVEDMTRAISIIMAGEGSFAPPVVAKASSAPTSDSKAQDDYMSMGFYADSGSGVKSGFDKFQKGDAGLHYFTFKSDDGNVLLLSQGYTAEAGRDNGISSVENNGKIEKRYETHSEGGKYYFTLKAGNHQEIARSVEFDSEADMNRAMGIVMAGGGSMSATMTKASSSPSKDDASGQDEYNDLSFYTSSGTGLASGFDKFQGGDGQYFFTYNGNGDIILLSQGYSAEAGRDNGIASVTKNASLEKRYSTGSEDGKYYFSLKAGNHQEVGRSRYYDSEADMKAAMGLMMGLMMASAGSTSSSSSSDASTEGSTTSTETGGEGLGLAASGAMAGATEVVKSSSKDDTPVVKREKEDDYLPCKEYEGHDINDKVNNVAFFKHENGQFYFVVYKADGSVRLRSEGFGSAKERDVELSGMLKNINDPGMYSTIKSGKYAIHILKDKDGREVGRSCLEKEGDAVPAKVETAAPVAEVVEEAPTVEAEESSSTVEAIAATTAAGAGASALMSSSSSSTEKEDDYLPCKAYEGHSVNDKVNNVAFFKHENGQFYFVVYKADGSVRLRSEGFGSAKDRDVELSGLLKNLNNPDMYHTITRGKYSIHVLKDKDGREVGRSCLEKEEEATPAVVEKSAEVVEESATVETVGVAAASAGAATVVASSTSEEKEDDYLPCKAYEGHPLNDKKNNIAFFKHENGQFYFAAYNKDGSVRLRSEGFGSAKERDVELSGLLKNIDNSDMYTTIKRGKYSIHILKDKDGREVGRSCLEKEEAIAPVVVEETTVVEKSVEVETPTAEVEESSSMETAAIAAGAAGLAGIAATTTSETEEVEVDKEDDYLPCKEYEGHRVNDKRNNVALFKHDNGQFYFAIYNGDGSVRLRSEGFRSGRERDSELSGALKGLDNDEMYTTLRRGKYFMHVLKDKTGREVGRSCLQKEEAKSIAAPVAVAAAAVATPVVKEVIRKKKVEIEDDYLPCKAYAGHKVTDKKNNIALFQHENGQHYFVAYKEDGSVKLRSEGFPSATEREGELNAVIRHKDNAEMYSKIEAQGGKYVIHVLKDENGKEVGRSCLEKVGKTVSAGAATAAAAAAAAALAATTKVETVEEVIEPTPEPVVEAPKEIKKVVTGATSKAAGVGGTTGKVAAGATATAAAKGAAASGGFNWKWLLPLLLLIPLFFWWKSCDTGKVEMSAPAVTVPEVKKPEVAATTPEPVKEVAPAPVAATCNCSGRSNSAVFNLPSNGTPKSLTRLGTSPEFGNSHGLSGAQFYNKLKTAAAGNARDKQFLDQVFKAMGFGSFADANAGMFSEVTLRKGTRGNMGFGGSKHRTLYATLNTSGRDLQAFKINAKNGCHLHFMKTCGNHFFFCPN